MGLTSTIKEYSSVKRSTSKSKVVKEVFNYSNIECQDELKRLVVNEVGKNVLTFCERHLKLSNDITFVTSTNTRFNIDKLKKGKFTNVINLQRINNVRWVNKFFESVNGKIEIGGIYINSVETYTTRRIRILRRLIPPFNYFLYTADIFITRVFPKVPFTKKIYFFITKGHGRVLSRAETFGRLYSCGFEIVDEQLIGDELFFVARKIKEPVFDNNPTYGPIIRLKRHGKGGKLFNVYKLRTMHAYSEYLQQYVYEHNDLMEGGKFKNDFRITTEGQIFRKFWIDELPMFINVFKGNMKIVGVRPLSKHYFSLYSDELKQKRIKFKPGLVPPFYVDNPKTLDEIMDSEMRYLEAYEKSPFFTDIKYFFKAFYNIVFKRARSG
jgi:lipopolysaccharide/colanic/teichoic acid biosynthesis glycosyltransferase